MKTKTYTNSQAKLIKKKLHDKKVEATKSLSKRRLDAAERAEIKGDAA
jgi:hypothetical protein